MKNLKGIIIFIIVLAAVIFAAVKAGGILRAKVLSATGRTDLQRPKTRKAAVSSDAEKALPAKKVSGDYAVGDEVALFFKDGSSMVGDLVAVSGGEYVINWKGQETVIFASQLDRIGDPKEALSKKRVLSDKEVSDFWPFNNDIVVRLTNRAVLDAVIKDVEEDHITLLYLVDEGGSIEQDVKRSKVEHLIFKPIENDESRKTRSTLEKFFPEMEFYRFGNFTIVSDSNILWVNECSQVLRNVYTNIYFKFFGLLKDRTPQAQNYVVIFDSFIDFVEYAIADGVPGWMVAGYFRPDDKILYLFNVLGEEFSEILFEALVGESGRQIDELVERAENRYDDRYDIFIEGEAKGIRNKYWEAYSYYKNLYREGTLSTLRHEFTHQMFSSWGLQNIMLSKVERDKERLIKKKKEFLETDDYAKKAEIVKSIIAIKGKGELPDMRAANSWLVEGIATYCETNPTGSRNKRWLYLFQEAVRKNAVNPIEALTVYRMGSFPGVYYESMLYMYAQSWAFVTFLMNSYPDEFMKYQERMAGVKAEGQEDINWLIEYIGKDLRVVDNEFRDYMAKFEELEDPFIVQFERLYNIFHEFD
ncbi:MAG: hypothetical protein ISS26_02580 [Candidatus Omnitrophica bacterium]|nr:hypothetical protein [Candidatus Omnitrophota bacterium]